MKITVFHIKGETPFITAVYGKCTVAVLCDIENDFVQDEEGEIITDANIDENIPYEYDYEMHYQPEERQESDAYGEVFVLPGYWYGNLIEKREISEVEGITVEGE
jgi:hypothetical protein